MIHVLSLSFRSPVLRGGGSRFFTSSCCCLKDEKSKQLLKELGMNLQKGQLKNDESTPVDRDDDSPSPKPGDNHKNAMNQYFDTISHMTSDDLIIQTNLDQGRQLFSFPLEHFIDRKTTLRNLPNEIDLFDPKQLEEIDSIYSKLAALDNDKSVHLKYFKRYLSKYDNPVTLLIQQFNGINKKFKLLRRKEMDNLSLAPGAYLYHENLFKLPYNVIGFDRSISGLPLRKSQEQVKCWPQEFVEDLQMFRTKIPIQKRDLDFIEHDESTTNINPMKINQKSLSRSSKTDQINNFLSNIYNKIDVPEKTIMIDSIDDYQSVNLNQNLIIRIESEILLIKKSLQLEIEQVMKNTSNSRSILMFGNQTLKHNQFKLCETNTSNTNNILVINYNLKQFNLIPNYALLMRNRRHLNFLKMHLMKIFLINLEDQIDTLFRIKYYRNKDMDKFMKRLVNSIRNVIKFKLLKLFKPLAIPTAYDALIYSPYKNSGFKRIYWLNDFRPKTNDGIRCRKSALCINWKNLDNLIEY